MLHDQALAGLARNVDALARAQERVGTGRRLNRLSDDPAQVSNAVNLRGSLAELEQYVRNIDAAERRLSAAEAALGSAGDIVLRAHELAVQGANDTLSASDRQMIGAEISQLLNTLVELSATRVAGAYIFSGFRTDVRPYATAGGPYQGDNGAIMARTAPGTTIQVNVSADVVFAPAIDALVDLAAEMTAGTRTSAATISALEAGQDALLVGRARIGATQAGLAETRSYLEGGMLASTRLLSDLEDADMAEVISELTQREATYQAALQVNARILKRSLLDEL
jgi:flagellar hook-associated protein 3 FlgL